MIIIFLLFVLGTILVVKGGDIFVDSAVKVSKATGLPEFFIGATIVSLGTTLPEVTVSSTAVLKGYTEMSVGNSLGSIICNLGLILGLVNLLSPSRVEGKAFKIKSFVLVSSLLIFSLLSLDRGIARLDSAILLLLLVAYIGYDAYTVKRRKSESVKKSITPLSGKEKIKTTVNFFLGVIGIIIGSNLLVNNGVEIAQYIGVPEAVISLTMIALGTSLPELVTSLTALVKGYKGLSVGNILGANILNIFLVIGVSSSISGLSITAQNLYLDVPVALLLSFILIIPSLKSKRISRIQGIVLLSAYVGYLALLYTLHM